jgi:hypothetical protein
LKGAHVQGIEPGKVQFKILLLTLRVKHLHAKARRSNEHVQVAPELRSADMQDVFSTLFVGRLLNTGRLSSTWSTKESIGAALSMR